jgi:hypothetical protein
MSNREYVVREQDGLWGVWLGDRLISGQPTQMAALGVAEGRAGGPPRPGASQRRFWSAISMAVRSSSGRRSRASRRRRRHRKSPARGGAELTGRRTGPVRDRAPSRTQRRRAPAVPAPSSSIVRPELDRGSHGGGAPRMSLSSGVPVLKARAFSSSQGDLLVRRRHMAMAATPMSLPRSIGAPFLAPKTEAALAPAGESGEESYAAMRLARKSSSHAATFRLRRRESLPGAFRMRL